MADAKTLYLTMTKHGNDIGTDHEGEYAQLGQGDSLQVQIDGSFDGTAGITRVDIYTSEQEKDSGNVSSVYWPGAVGTLQNQLTFNSDSNGSQVTSVTMTDAENPTVDDIFWYKVTAGGAKLDPEVMNKAGSDKGSAQWVRLPQEAALVEVIRRNAAERAKA